MFCTVVVLIYWRGRDEAFITACLMNLNNGKVARIRPPDFRLSKPLKV